MLSTRIRLALLLLVSPALVGAAPIWDAPAACALRCRCRSTYPQNDSTVAADQWGRADAIVLARVVAHDVLPAQARTPTGDAQLDSVLRAASGPVVVRLAVERRWKGPTTDTLVLAVQTSDLEESSCDLWLRVGGRYLVFATRGAVSDIAPAYADMLGSTQCMGTQEAAQVSAETLRALDAAAVRAP